MSIELPDPQASDDRRKAKLHQRSFQAFLVVFGAIFLYSGWRFASWLSRSGESAPPEMSQCRQAPLIEPDFEGYGLKDSAMFASPEYANYSTESLAGAVRIPTVSYDDMDMDVSREPRFEVFHESHAYFAEKFPHSWKHVEKVNTYGSLYTIEGSDPDSKPIVLMAHQDVVPVAPETVDEWVEEPFGGVFDGEWSHGRGTCDTKNTLVAMHEAVEASSKQHWTPARTSSISVGFDEEIQGFRGAKSLAQLLEDRYGPDSVEMSIDEGLGITEIYGQYFATPAVAEKGRSNFKFTSNTPGGHSSIPPDHTGIGIMADFVTRLESDVPSKPSFAEHDVIKGSYACYGAFADDDELSSDLRHIYTRSSSPAIASELAQMLGNDRFSRVNVETTQAIDIVHGGVKINASPEQVVMEVNYRIKPDSSVDEETQRVSAFVKELARDFKLGVNVTNSFFPSPDEKPEVLVPMPGPSEALGFLLVETTDVSHVAPVSPFYNDTHWDLISGTTKHVIEQVAPGFDEKRSLIMAPGLMTGNTDTAHYWNLTKNSYRYIPMSMSDARNIHTVNEALRPRSHISTVTFFYEFLVNMDTEL